MMETAGEAVAQVIMQHYELQPIFVICGPGNNGGDGYVVARYLKEQGWPVRLMGVTQKNPAAAVAKWSDAVIDLNPDLIPQGTLIVDALFGTGLERHLADPYKSIIECVNKVASAVISIDIPSGIHTDTAEVLGSGIDADITVTFNFRKPAHVLLPGRDKIGLLVIKDIGLKLPHENHKVYINHPSLWKHLYPLPDSATHKYERGYVHIYGGDEITGAARLAALSARRMGAGMVMIESLPATHEIYAAENIGVLTRVIESPREFGLDPRVTCALIGPGSGRKPFVQELVLEWLKQNKPTVLDADALYVFKDKPMALFAAIQAETVLTPHEAEFHRLFALTDGKIYRTKEAARLSHATVLLKGADTIIADPAGLTIIQDHSSSYLATGGTGDVLAGMISALLGQKLSGLASAAIATWVHTAIAEKIGLGLIAEDLPDHIPDVLKEILAKE